MDRVVLIRYGEIGLKGTNRRWFEKTLAANLQEAAGREGAFLVENLYGRLLLRPTGAASGAGTGDAPGAGGGASGAAVERAAQAAARVFGVVGAVPAWETPLEVDDIVEAAALVLSPAIASMPDGTPLTFKVAARRSNKRFPLDSLELNREVGGRLLKRFGDRLRVDVHEPSAVVHVEVRDREAFVYGGESGGPGGLPVGVSGKALALISGGIDSPVAAWMAMKRGLRTGAIHFHAMPFTTEQARLKVVRLAERLAGWQGSVRLYMTRFTEVQKAIYASCPPELGVLLMRRMMVRIACTVAARDGFEALVTGENLGQVASQTLESMGVVEAAADRMILRPLVALDKEEIVASARRIGTYETSIEPFEDCCTLFVPRHPETRPTLHQVEAAERSLAVEDLVSQAAGKTEVTEVGDGATPASALAP